MFVVDVDGDGKADLVIADNTGIFVRRSTGSKFGPREQWSTENLKRSESSIVVQDMDGDKKS